MDHFCHHIIEPELAEVTAWPPPDPMKFIFSPANIPLLGQHDTRSGQALLNSNLSAEGIQDILKTRRYRNTEDLASEKPGRSSSTFISPV